MESSDSSLHFSEEDIRTQLELLGYHNVSRHRLHEFAKDLESLITLESLPAPGQHYDDSSFVSDSSSSAAYFSTEAPNIRRVHSGAIETETTRPEYQKHQVYRDHTMYGKENHAQRENRPVTAPTYHPRIDLGRHNPNKELLESSIDSAGSSDQQRRSATAQWPNHEKKAPMKRKVLRKKGGQSQIFDESITESEADVTDEISYLNDRLHEIPLPSHEDQDTDSVLTDASSSTHRITGRRRPVTSTTLYSHRPSGDEDSVFKPHLPRSFIRPSSAQPKNRHDHKTDPVTRHQMYQTEWNAMKAPGEKSRKDLRWNVREQMMYKSELPKPQNQPRVYVANTYKVPTDKKRQALRWAVRTSLAQKQMPYTTFEL